MSGFSFSDVTPKGTDIAEVDRTRAGDAGGSLLGGGTYSLSQDLGKVVVINLWASWCGPCRVEMQGFERLYQAQQKLGLNIVGFAVHESSDDDARGFLLANEITYPNVYDDSADVATRLGDIPIAGLPVTVLIDKRGFVAAVYFGIVDEQQLSSVTSQLIAEG